MAIDAKVSFMNQMEKKLQTEITMDSMMKVMTVVADVMEGFEMRETLINMNQNDDLLDCYLDALKVQGRSEKTIHRYRYIIKRMMEEVGVHTRQITVYHLRNYLAKMQDRGTADSTTEGVRQILSAYFNWLQRESLIDRNPTANLGAIKCAKKKKKTFTEVDLDNLKSNCACERDKAIICFLSATGCRVSEATGLNRQDIDFNGMQCVVHGKGNKERTVFLDPVAATMLNKYLSERNDNNPALFVGKRHERLTPSGVREMMRKLALRSGVDHVHPHKFRRTLATDLARHGMPIQQISSILGHDKIDTTMTYVMQNDEDIKYSYRRYA